MFDYLKGHLVETSPEKVVLDVHGIGFSVHIPLSTYHKLPDVGTLLHLWITPVYREEAQTLYGFAIPEERSLFNQMLSITGIGPKVALSLVSHIDLHSLHSYIEQADPYFLAKIPGIGKKTASRLLLELQNRQATLPFLKAEKTPNPLAADGKAALMQLGYSAPVAQKAIQAALQKLSEEGSLSQLITLALHAL